ncbi:MAG: hypothetical protein Q8R37_01740 [Nanoarchaeota archaeon]|nr:hypothetical protein [Nanoarchaeota archaeon]
MDTEIVKMSLKGQLVVPQEIREAEGFNAGDRFVPLPVKNGVLFKRVKIPNVRIEFEKLSKEIEGQFKKHNITGKDVDEAVRWARKKLS